MENFLRSNQNCYNKLFLKNLYKDNYVVHSFVGL